MSLCACSRPDIIAISLKVLHIPGVLHKMASASCSFGCCRWDNPNNLDWGGGGGGGSFVAKIVAMDFLPGFRGHMNLVVSHKVT